MLYEQKDSFLKTIINLNLIEISIELIKSMKRKKCLNMLSRTCASFPIQNLRDEQEIIYFVVETPERDTCILGGRKIWIFL